MKLLCTLVATIATAVALALFALGGLCVTGWIGGTTDASRGKLVFIGVFVWVCAAAFAGLAFTLFSRQPQAGDPKASR